MVSVMNVIDSGHESIIHGAELDYYGLNLATCSSDNSIKIFDVKNGEHSLTMDLKGHSGPVWQIAWAHPKFGTVLASCSYDRKVIIWRKGYEWTKWYEYCAHDSSVNSVAWAPQEYGLVLACGSSDGSVSVLTCNLDGNNWDAHKISNAHTIGCNAVSWCPPLYLGSNGDKTGVSVKRLATGGCDNLVKIWREDTTDRWVEENRLELHTDWVRDVAWAPSIGLQRTQIASCGQDRRVIIWSSEDCVNWSPQILHTFEDVAWNVSWSTTGNLLAVSGGNNKVSLWRENNDAQWSCISEDQAGTGSN